MTLEAGRLFYVPHKRGFDEPSMVKNWDAIEVFLNGLQMRESGPVGGGESSSGGGAPSPGDGDSGDTHYESDTIYLEIDGTWTAVFLRYTDAEVDTIVATHTADDDAHHAKYTDAEALAAFPMCVLSKSSAVDQNVGGANGTEVWWTWNGEIKKDTGFTHDNSTNSERVTVAETGWYEVKFMGNVQQTGSARSTLQGIIRVDGGTTQRLGSVRDYSRGSGYGNLSPGLDCIIELTADEYIEVGTRVEDTDGVYTISTNGAEIADDENMLIVR